MMKIKMMDTKKVNDIAYSFSWCEFLDPCPYGKDCMVGDCDCCECEHNKHNEIFQELNTFDEIGTLRYFRYGYGYVKCNYENGKNN